MVATAGAKLLPDEAVTDLRALLVPRATVLTPNIPEARLLLASAGFGHMAIESVADLEAMARAVLSLGPQWVLVKGGHSPFRRDLAASTTPGERHLVVDVLVGPDYLGRIETPYQESRHTHGTGCSLACKFQVWPPRPLPSDEP